MALSLAADPALSAALSLEGGLPQNTSSSSGLSCRLYESQAFQLPGIWTESPQPALRSGSRRVRHAGSELALQTHSSAQPLFIESESWWGQLYGHFVRGGTVADLKKNKKLAQHLPELHAVLNEMKNLGLIDLTFNALMALPVNTLANFIASEITAYLETLEFMRGLQAEIGVVELKTPYLNGPQAFFRAKTLIAQNWKQSIRRHTRAYFKGETMTREAALYEQSMRAAVNTWTSDSLVHWVARHLMHDHAEHPFQNSYRRLIIELYHTHRMANRHAVPIDAWRYASHIQDISGHVFTLVDPMDAPQAAEEGNIWVRASAQGGMRQIPKQFVRPILTMPELALSFQDQVQAYPTMDNALKNGWISPDLPQGDRYDQDYYLAHSIGPLRDRFVLAFPRDQVLDLHELAKALGKTPDQIYDLMDVDKLKPVQEVWLASNIVMPYFLKSDLLDLQAQWAPEKVAGALSLKALAQALGRRERAVSMAIADGSLPVRRIGPIGNSYYVITPQEIAKYKVGLKPKVRTEGREPLQYPRNKLFSTHELAEELGIPPNALFKMVNLGDIDPVQSARRPEDGRMDHYFLREKKELYIRIYAPHKVKDAYTLDDLVAELGATEYSVRHGLKDGLIEPQDVIGSLTNPYFIVPEEDIQRFKHVLKGDSDRISLTALAQKYKTHLSTILVTIQWLRIPVRTRIRGGAITRTISLAEEKKLADNLPEPPPPGTIPTRELSERLGVDDSRVVGLPGDFEARHGSEVHRHFRTKGLPNKKDRVAVERWLTKRAQRVEIAHRRGARVASVGEAWIQTGPDVFLNAQERAQLKRELESVHDNDGFSDPILAGKAIRIKKGRFRKARLGEAKEIRSGEALEMRYAMYRAREEKAPQTVSIPPVRLRALQKAIGKARKDGWSYRAIGYGVGLHASQIQAINTGEHGTNAVDEEKILANLKKLADATLPFGRKLRFNQEDISLLRERLLQLPLHQNQDIVLKLVKPLQDILRAARKAGHSSVKLALASGLSDTALRNVDDTGSIQLKNALKMLDGLEKRLVPDEEEGHNLKASQAAQLRQDLRDIFAKDISKPDIVRHAEAGRTFSLPMIDHVLRGGGASRTMAADMRVAMQKALADREADYLSKEERQSLGERTQTTHKNGWGYEVIGKVIGEDTSMVNKLLRKSRNILRASQETYVQGLDRLDTLLQEFKDLPKMRARPADLQRLEKLYRRLPFGPRDTMFKPLVRPLREVYREIRSKNPVEVIGAASNLEERRVIKFEKKDNVRFSTIRRLVVGLERLTTPAGRSQFKARSAAVVLLTGGIGLAYSDPQAWSTLLSFFHVLQPYSLWILGSFAVLGLLQLRQHRLGDDHKPILNLLFSA